MTHNLFPEDFEQLLKDYGVQICVIKFNQIKLKDKIK